MRAGRGKFGVMRFANQFYGHNMLTVFPLRSFALSEVVSRFAEKSTRTPKPFDSALDGRGGHPTSQLGHS